METTILEDMYTGNQSPCISIIVPTHQVSSDRQMDPLMVKKAVEKAKELLHLQYPNNGVAELADKMDALTGQIDYLHNKQGVGLFISSGTARLVNFSFPVKERITVGDSFEVRDLVYMSEKLSEYYVLALSQNMIHLFKANGQQLVEIKDGYFPVTYIDDYEYAKPSPGQSFSPALKSTENDKSFNEQMRLSAFFKKVDDKLTNHLGIQSVLVLTGVKKELASFQKVSTHKKNIIAKVPGNYTHNFHELGELTFKEVKKFREKEENIKIAELNESIGRHMAVSGIEEVWKATQLGKGLLLLVEKDFSMPGFIKENDLRLYKRPPEGEHKIVTDAVDDVMEKVLELKGNVTMVENGKLEDHGRIAMILRYP